ncbi:MAG: heavy-metal-associated domain-containing protein [Bacteroidales bacterium]
MTTEKIMIENLKCHGCAKTITNTLSAMEGVENVEVSVDEGSVTFSYNESQQQKDQILHKLAKLGYPEKGNNNFRSQAKSFVSCAVGRMSK